MKTPDLSFVIPAYNAQDYLSDAILSCLKQTHKNIEVIVVDDGSSDSTRRLIQHFTEKDPRCHAILFSANCGRGHARNQGNALARAPIIAVLDADDMAERDRAKNTLEQLDRGVLHGAASVVDSLGNEIGRIKVEDFNLKKALEDGVNRIVHSTMAYRKADIRKWLYDEGEYATLGLDDWKFQLDLALDGTKFKKTDKILSAWRSNSEGVSNVRDIAKVKTLKDQFLKRYAA